MPLSSPAANETDHTGAIPEIELLGFKSHPGTIEDYVALIRKAVEDQQKITVFYHNLHSLYTYFTSSRLRQCYDKYLTLVDGMPVIWLLRLAGLPVTRDHRVTYVDFIWPMLESARDNNQRVFHLGQSAEVQQQALDIIRARVPGLKISGHDGYFDLTTRSSETMQVIQTVNNFETDLLLVGFGAPKQEYWVEEHRDLINASALFTCGACMEYVAGAVKTPPRWMGRLGLEWSYRLLENPRRFAFRYLVEPPLLGAILLRNLLFRSRSGKP
ncbi:MAG: WecB/TagA/CpsF family glycosyltransferase [Gammaproteobacteria bacterium]|nr:WecB/TagA/CpsF family glycosyltransferase [Gammaproteobacteria bacterium]